MKKLFAIVLTLALVLALGTTVFAYDEQITTNNGTATSGNVTASVTTNNAADTISVDVTWGTLSFDYSQTATWDPATHTSGVTGGAWALTSTYQTVATVANHSNVAVTATASFTKANGTDYTATFEHASQDLATAVGTALNEAPSATFAMRVAGSAPANNAVLGTITITIAKQ